MRTPSSTLDPSLKAIALRIAKDPVALEKVKRSTAQIRSGRTKTPKEIRDLFALKQSNAQGESLNEVSAQADHAFAGW